MRSMALAAFGLFVLPALTGCVRLTGQPAHGYAPIVQMDDNTSWPLERWQDAPGRRGPRSPKTPAPIEMEALFIAAKPGYLAQLGIPPGQPFQILSAGERAKILAETLPDEPVRKPLLLPKLKGPKLPLDTRPAEPARRLFLQRGIKFSLHPGVNASVISPNPLVPYQYVGEADMVEGAPDSGLMTVSDGTALGIEVGLEGSTFVFTRIEPEVAAYLGLRSVTAKAEVDGQRREIFWQEPAVLEATGQVAAPCQIKVEPGESLLLPLRHTLFIGHAKSRTLARPGTLREQYDKGTRDLRHPDRRGYPLRNDAFLLLTPRLAERKEPAK